MNLKENETIKLNDGNKYWIVKKIVVDGIDFYYTIKVAKEPEIIIFADRDGLQIVDDEVVLEIVNKELIKQFSA